MAWSSHARKRPRPSSAAEKRFRDEVLRRDRYTCQVRGPRCVGNATQADHIVSWEEGGSHDPSNGQAVCDPCHAQKTQEEAQRARARWKRRPPRHPGLDAQTDAQGGVPPQPLPPRQRRGRFA